MSIGSKDVKQFPVNMNAKMKAAIFAYFEKRKNWVTDICVDDSGRVFFTDEQKPFGCVYISPKALGVAFVLCDMYEWEDTEYTSFGQAEKKFSQLNGTIKANMPLDSNVYRVLAKNEKGQYCDILTAKNKKGVFSNAANMPQDDSSYGFNLVETCWNEELKQTFRPVHRCFWVQGAILSDISI